MMSKDKRKEYYQKYYHQNKKQIQEYQRNYYRKKHPHVINTKKDHIKFQNQILLQHPEGLLSEQIQQKLLKHEGRLGFTKMQTASYLRQNPNAIGIGNNNNAKRWYHITHVHGDITTETRGGEGGAVEKTNKGIPSHPHFPQKREGIENDE